MIALHDYHCMITLEALSNWFRGGGRMYVGPDMEVVNRRLESQEYLRNLLNGTEEFDSVKFLEDWKHL